MKIQAFRYLIPKRPKNASEIEENKNALGWIEVWLVYRWSFSELGRFKFEKIKNDKSKIDSL